MSEISFTPTSKAPPVTLKTLQQRLTSTGLACSIEQDSPTTCWITFEPYESTIYASTKDSQVTQARFSLELDDEMSVLSTVEGVMETLGFTADET